MTSIEQSMRFDSLTCLPTVILSFLKRELIVVARRYCVPVRTFLDVPDSSVLQLLIVTDRLHERFMSIS